jgi:hypothetical protein
MNMAYENILLTINNLHLENILYMYIFISLLVILGILFALLPQNKTKTMTNNQVYEYIEDNIWQYNFWETIHKIVVPDKGDYVILQNGRWDNLYGQITRYNEDDTYNIKITKKLNPYNNDFPKRRITRERDEFIIEKY